jgi:catechol 2,3-dioxygenase-like lactoylglutathione lyase family enzyme
MACMIESVRFVGLRTTAYAEMAALYRDVLGLDVEREAPGAAWFRTADGTSIHIYAADDPDHDFFGAGPVVGFLVDDFAAARAAMVAQGFAFIGEPQRDGDAVWNHYRAPDGNVYELIGREPS